MRVHFALIVLMLSSSALALLSACDCAGPSARVACDDTTDCGAGEICRGGVCTDDGSSVDGGGGSGDASLPRDGAVVGRDAGSCRDITSESTVAPVPVDIIIAIDNSGSMSEEAAEVRRNINRFAEIIAASGLDYRVVLVSRPDGERGVCVPAPLGSGPPGCGSGAEGRLLAVHVPVGSTNAPDLVLESYPDYRSFLREGSAKIFLWITDDESGNYSADDFRAALAALEPAGMFDQTIHNAIVGYYGDTAWSDPGAGTCDSLADVGATYLRLANCLDDADAPIGGCVAGHQNRVCETDWTTIFEEIARGVVEGVPVACEFPIPEAPMGMMLDLDEIRLTYSAGDGSRTALTRASAAAACGADGWHFDDAASPASIVLCPELCAVVQADEAARIDIALGCFPVLE